MSRAKKEEKAPEEQAVVPKDPAANLPVDIQEQIKQELADQKNHLGALPSNKIALKDKKFTLPDGQSSPGPLECIVVDFVWAMSHYKGVYNAANPQSPNCFAIGRDAPESGLLKPNATKLKELGLEPQGASCAECPKNEWGSAHTGRGKACKNQRRVIVLPPNFESLDDAMTLYVSPQGLKNFDSYVNRLKNEHGLLPVQVITEISFDADKSYPLLKFRFLDTHARVSEAWAIKEQAQDLLFRDIEIKKEKDK